jgi:diguanylate cyclase (GGDEF)-like protein
MDSLAREKGRADRSNTPVSVCIFDLDHFKALNDKHGHLVGDRVLKRFAKRVRGELRAMDLANPSEHRRSFGRFGGEEFIAILPSTTLTGAGACGERIRAAVADRPFDDVYQVTVSAGVAQYQRGETVPQLLARADEALYRAKAEGRNRVELDGKPEPCSAEVHTLRPSNR